MTPPRARIPVPSLSIAEVERTTGIPRATLRIWERRYGFPRPARDAADERIYPMEQVERLRLVQSLVMQGGRPGGLVTLTKEELQKRLARPGAAVADAPTAALLELARAHDVEGLVRHLQQSLVRLGLAGFVADLAAPAAAAVGEAWRCGELQVYEEHLCTQALQLVLSQAILGLPSPGATRAPRALLATPSNELHGLGLLMVQALLAAEGFHCVPLGVSVPLAQIAEAAVQCGCDVAAVSLSAATPSSDARRSIAALREMLPGGIELWVGGASAGVPRLRLAGVRTFSGLDTLPQAVQALRERVQEAVRG